METMLNINQVAFILKVHPLTIRRYIKEKKLPAVKAGGNVRIMETALTAFTKDFFPRENKSVFRKAVSKESKIFSADDPLFQMEGRGAGLSSDL